MEITKRLYELADESYADFQAKLMPAIDRNLILGVRVPLVRKLAGEIVKSGEYREFIDDLPHRYYDENMLHGLILSGIKNYDECIAYVDAFLPYVDNWAVCDTMSPKCFAKNRNRLMDKIQEWTSCTEPYTVRFGIEMLMTHFLDEDFKCCFLEIPASVRSDEYYVKMMVAWFFATALAKQWDAAVPYIENGQLELWTHNKTIQKARESFRITNEQKAYLKTLKR